MKVQYCIDKYTEVQQQYFDGLSSAREQIITLANEAHPAAGGTKVWNVLLGDLDAHLSQTLYSAATWQSVLDFQKTQDMPQAMVACRHLVQASLDFNNLFVRRCVAEKTDSWEFVRQYFSNPAHGTSGILYSDLKRAYEAVELLLNTLQKITSLMQECRDFIPSDDIDTLETDLSYWAQVVGQWFNYVWANVAQESPAGPAGTAGTAAASAASRPSTRPQDGTIPATAPTTPGSSAPLTTSDPLPVRRPLLVPKVAKAPNLPGKFKKGFLRRGNKVLPDDHAAKVADAVKYNAMMMQLLVRRIRKDLVGIEGPFFALKSHAAKDNMNKWALLAYSDSIDQLQHQLGGLLFDTEGQIRDFKSYDRIIRQGADSLTLEDAADAAAAVNSSLARIGKLIDTSIAPAASLRAAIEQHKKADGPSDDQQWQALKEHFETLATHSASTGRKCRKILERLNSILRDDDFKHKHLNYQGIGRITGKSAGQQTIEITCVITINKQLVKARKYVAQVRRNIPAPTRARRPPPASGREPGPSSLAATSTPHTF